MVGACYALNLSVVPVSYTAFREYQFEIRNRVAAFLLQEGVFTTISDDLTVYVRSRDPDGTLRGILIEDNREKNSRATILAERGRLLDGREGPRVMLENASRQEIDKTSGRLNLLTFKEQTITLSRGGKGEEVRYRDAAELSLSELADPANALNTRDAGKMLVEAQRRLSAPWTAVSFALVALLSALTGAFQRHGTVLRPLVAVLAIVGLLALGLAVANLATRAPALIPLIWLHALLPGVACAIALFVPAEGWGRFARGPAAAAALR